MASSEPLILDSHGLATNMRALSKQLAEQSVHFPPSASRVVRSPAAASASATERAEAALLESALSFDSIYDRFSSWNASIVLSVSADTHRVAITSMLCILSSTENLALAAALLGTLRCWARVDSNKHLIVRKGGVPLIIKWMLRCVHVSAPVFSKACIALANLVMHPQYEEMCVLSGAIEIASDGMRAHPQSIAVQTDAASLLCNLAFTSRFTDRIIKHGVVKLVCDAMRNFPEDAFLIEECCGCLRNFAGGTEQNAVAVFESGALPLAMEALERHGINPRVAEEALHCIRNISCATRIRDRVVGSFHVFAQSVAAARLHADNRSIAQIVAGSLLYMTARASAAVVAAAAEQGVIEWLIEALQTHILIQSVEPVGAEVDAGLELGTSPMASSPSSAISSKDANAARSPTSAATVSVAESPSGGARADSSLNGTAKDEPVPELVAESEGSDEDEDENENVYDDEDEDEDDDFQVEMEADADNHDHHQFHELALKPEAELIYSTCKTLYVMLRADPGALTLAGWKLGLFLHTSNAAAAAAARAKARPASAGRATVSADTEQMRGLDCMLQLIRGGYSTPETQFGPHYVLFACAQCIFRSSPGGGFEGSTELDELLASARESGPPILCALGARGLCALTDRSRALTVEFLIRAGVYCHARVDMRMRETVHEEAAHLLHAFQTEAGAGAVLGEATAAAVVDGQHIIETLLSSPLGGFGSHMHAHMQNSGIEGVHLAGSTEAADSTASVDSSAASLLSSPMAASMSPPLSHAALSALDCVRPAATRARLYALHSAVQRQMQASAMVALVEEFAPIGPTDVMRVVATYLYSDAPSQSALDETAVIK